MQADIFASAAVREAGKGKRPANRKGSSQAELDVALQATLSAATLMTILAAEGILAKLLNEACDYTPGMYLRSQPAL